MLLINHRIPHVPLEFYECRFLLEMKGNHTHFSEGARRRPIKLRHTSITWIGRPTRERNRQYKDWDTIQWQVGLENSPHEEREGRWAQWGGRPTVRPPWSADRPMGPTAFRLHVAVPYWSLMSVQGGICPFPGWGEGGSPLYIWGEGLHSQPWRRWKISIITTSYTRKSLKM